MKQVWSCGGGTQSAAIAGLICEGKLEKPEENIVHQLMIVWMPLTQVFGAAVVEAVLSAAKSEIDARRGVAP